MKKKLELCPNNAEFISGVLTTLTGNTFIPRTDTPNNLLQYAYAIDDNEYIDNNVDGPNHKDLVMNSVIEDTGKDSREYIISKKLGLYSNKEQNGVDAYELDGFAIKNTWELKSERLRKNKKAKTGYSKLAGNFGISSKNIKHLHSVDTWIEKNDKMAISGWVEGKIAYVLSFTTKQSGIREHIVRRLKNNAKLENGGICFTYNNFIDTKDLKVEFVNKDLCTMEYVTAPLLGKIAELTEEKKPTKTKCSTVAKSTIEKYDKVIVELLTNPENSVLSVLGFVEDNPQEITRSYGISTLYRIRRSLN
jgi:hypothetical protein